MLANLPGWMAVVLLGAAASAGLCVYCVVRLLHLRARMRYILNTLEDMETANPKHRLLSKPTDEAAEICYRVNEIVAKQQGQILRLAQAEEANKQLMTSLSHDVRTPLTTLIGYLDAVHLGMVQGNERESYLETARKKAYAMKDYIDVLFDWFKLNSNEQTFDFANRELAEETREILKSWVPVFEERKLQYNIQIPDEDIFCRVDADAYQRILNNLIQNVLAHSQATEIELGVQRAGGQVCIWVADNGTGIPAGELRYIFDRLYKCDKGRTKSGSGLGLNIVQQLVQKIGGEISATSIPHCRTVFKVQFPAVTA
ncbi:MAG: HAMP domain-containing sensor histidine kinase [Gemmiger sp.]|nr:HAMP domain-containing sensor histidine kinase [Gemmiger sp.]